MNATKPKVLRTERSHTGHAGMIATVSDEPAGYIRRADVASVPSPYAYSPVKPVFRRAPDGKVVFIAETTHRCYKMFEVPSTVKVYATEDEALPFDPH